MLCPPHTLLHRTPLCVVFVTLCSLLCRRGVSAGSVYVSQSGTDSLQCGTADHPCKTIQRGVDQALAGDTVRVQPDVEPYGCGIVVEKTLKLTGLSEGSPSRVVLDCKGASRGIFFKNVSLTMDRLRIEGGFADSTPLDPSVDWVGGAAVAAVFSNHTQPFVQIQNCEFVGNSVEPDELKYLGSVTLLFLSEGSPTAVLDSCFFNDTTTDDSFLGQQHAPSLSVMALGEIDGGVFNLSWSQFTRTHYSPGVALDLEDSLNSLVWIEDCAFNNMVRLNWNSDDENTTLVVRRSEFADLEGALVVSARSRVNPRTVLQHCRFTQWIAMTAVQERNHALRLSSVSGGTFFHMANSEQARFEFDSVTMKVATLKPLENDGIIRFANSTLTGVALRGADTVSFTNCRVTGEGIELTGSYVSAFVTSCHFVGVHTNPFSLFGGSVDVEMDISNCSFVNNSHIDGMGGAVYIDLTYGPSYKPISIRDSLFQNNSAAFANALFLRGSAFALHNVEIVSSSSTDTGTEVFVPSDDTTFWLRVDLSNVSWLCPKGTVPVISHTQMACLTCGRPTYSLDTNQATDFEKPPSPSSGSQIAYRSCFACPSGADCSFGGAEIRILPGRWGVALDRPVALPNVRMDTVKRVFVTRCHHGYCSSHLHRLGESCLHHRSGRLCGACEPDHSQSISSEDCVPDDECNDGPWFWPLFVLLSATLLFYLLIKQPFSPGHFKITVLFYQVASVLVFRSKASVLFGLARFELHFPSLCPWRGLTTFGSLFFHLLYIALRVVLLSGFSLCVWTKFGFSPHVVEEHKLWDRIKACRSVLTSKFAHLSAATYTFIFSISSLAEGLLNTLHCVSVSGFSGTFVYHAAVEECYNRAQVASWVGVALTCALFVGAIWWMHSHEIKQDKLIDVVAFSFKRQFGPKLQVAVYCLLVFQVLPYTLLDVFVLNVTVRYVLFIVLTLALLCTHLLLQPFRFRSSNLLQFVCLLCLVLLCVSNFPRAALITSSGPLTSLPNTDALEAIAIATPAVIYVMFFVLRQSGHLKREQLGERVNGALVNNYRPLEGGDEPNKRNELTVHCRENSD